MKTAAATLLLTAIASATALAHFVFIIPGAEGARAIVIISETLMVDPEVSPELVRSAKLFVRRHGSDTPLTMKQTPDAYVVDVPGTGTRLIHGTVDLGVTTEGGGNVPNVLIYHPKAIVGDPFDAATVLGTAPVELIPVGHAGAVRLKLMARGMPQGDTEVTVILPGGSQKKVRTDASGMTEPIAATGQFGAWARYWEDTPGERNGRQYQQVRHYATVVFTVANSGMPVNR
jgi:hypothetical protein